MYRNFEITEVTKDNKHEFIRGIVKLEQTVLQKMIQQGKGEHLFITGEEGIKEYIESKNNHVFIAYKVNLSNKRKEPISVTYITEGQTAFTYNDITKYFKYGQQYYDYIKSKYSNTGEFKKIIREAYEAKIVAFKHAMYFIVSDYENQLNPLTEEQKCELLIELMNNECRENNFHEKSKIREQINKYMTAYMSIFKKNIPYEEFYWLDWETIQSELQDKEEKNSKNNKKRKSTHNKFDCFIYAYETFLQYQKFMIYEQSEGLDAIKYFNANTKNTIELDTYLTSDECREKGLARIVVFEGLKKSILDQKNNTNNNEIFLASTLHRDNLSSKYVSEFFGLKDNLYLNRRCGIDREVHICRINRDEIDEYLSKMEKKLVVLYSYNPNNIVVTKQERISILQEHIEYEQQEIKRLELLKPEENYKSYIESKNRKINDLKNQLQKIKNNVDFSDNYGDYSDK